MTYVALVPFAMSGIRLGPSPPVPYFGSLLETNIRLYSVDDAGRHGVVFRLLETSRLAVVPLTRIGLGIPYTWARMRLTRHGDTMTYDSVRRWPRRGLRSRLTITIGEVVEPTPLEVWLTARWGAHTRKAGRTWWVPNEHEPWSLGAATIAALDDDLLAASGVRATGERLRALYYTAAMRRRERNGVIAGGIRHRIPLRPQHPRGQHLPPRMVTRRRGDVGQPLRVASRRPCRRRRRSHHAPRHGRGCRCAGVTRESLKRGTPCLS